MKLILGGLLLALVFGYLAVGLDRSPPQPNLIRDANAAIDESRNHFRVLPTVSPNQGSHSVYRRIDTMTDCQELKATFEKNVYDSAGRQFGTFLQEVTLSYAKRAYDRMEKLGC